MFRHIAAGPQPAWKRPVYLVFTSVLGGLLSVLLQVLIALVGQGSALQWQNPWRIGGILFGLIVFWFIGRVWWRLVYVERRWAGK